MEACTTRIDLRTTDILMMKWIMAVTCLAVATFCVFGFLATFEPGAPNAIAFRMGYVVLGIGCLVGAVGSFISRKPS